MNRVVYSKTDLCNLALSQLGSDRLQLADFSSDTGTIKDTVNLFFPSVLEELTAMAAWNSCLISAQLSSELTSEDPDFGYIICITCKLCSCLLCFFGYRWWI